MINLVGSRVWLAPKNAKPAQPVVQQSDLPLGEPEQVAQPRPKHYKQETFLNTLFEISVGFSVSSAAVYGLVQLVHWTWHGLKVALPLGR